MCAECELNNIRLSTEISKDFQEGKVDYSRYDTFLG